MPKVVLHDTNGIKEFVILGEVTVGRLPENTVAVFDPQISRKHARISLENGQYVLEDLGSAGGTRVNNQPITRHVLQDADQIQVGGAHLVFLSDKPQTAGDGLFEKTMVGNDPLFAPTLVGGGSPVALPSPPPAPPPIPTSPLPVPPVSTPVHQPAAPQAADPAGRATVPIRPQIILPRKTTFDRRRLIQVVAGLLILSIGGLVLFQPFGVSQNLSVDWTVIEGLYRDGRIAEVEVKLKGLSEQALGESDRATLANWKIRLESIDEINAVEVLIYERKLFSEASRRALADGNRYKESSKRFSELAKIAISAGSILDAAQETAAAEQADQADILVRTIQRCREAEDRFRDSQAHLERLDSVVAARQTCASRLAGLEARLKQMQEAVQSWTDVKAARDARNWAAEVAALKRLVLAPSNLVDPLTTPAKIDSLLKNATAFLDGLNAFQKTDYDGAIRLLSSIETGDFHEVLAHETIAEMRAMADYSAGVKLYREGKGEAALAALTNAKTEKAVQLRVRIQSTMAGIQKLVVLQERKALEELIAESALLLPKLEAPEDEFYRLFVEKVRTGAQRQRIGALFAELEPLVQSGRLGDAFLKSGALLRDPDLSVDPEIKRKTAEMNESLLKTIQRDVGTWVRSAEQPWNQYKQEPITSEERTAAGGVSVSFRRKAALLKQAFEKIAQVQGVVQALPDEKAKPVIELYEQIRQEVLRQAEKIFVVRTQYSQLGNFDLTRQADEMIVLLGDVPGNQYYRLIVKKE